MGEINGAGQQKKECCLKGEEVGSTHGKGEIRGAGENHCRGGLKIVNDEVLKEAKMLEDTKSKKEAIELGEQTCKKNNYKQTGESRRHTGERRRRARKRVLASIKK